MREKLWDDFRRQVDQDAKDDVENDGAPAPASPKRGSKKKGEQHDLEDFARFGPFSKFKLIFRNELREMSVDLILSPWGGPSNSPF